MSDRYKQLDIVEYLEQVDAPKVGKKSKPKIESEMYPNFSVGEIVEYLAGVGYNQEEIRQGKILEILGKDWYRVGTLNGYQFFGSSAVIKKVRVHCLLPEHCKTAAQEPDSQEEDHKSPSIHYEIKEIKGRLYKYARWWQGDRHKSKYIGRA